MNIPIDITQVTLKTDRLLLRPWRMSDLEDFYEYARVDGVGQMAGWAPHESIDISRGILERFISGKKVFALEHEGKVIGSLGIEKYDENKFPEFSELKCREIGYVLSKDYWGRGLMPEAVGEVIRYLFEDLGADAIFCGYFVRNRQSARVQEKCGFKHYSTIKYQTRMGTVEDTQVNILYRKDWEDSRI